MLFSAPRVLWQNHIVQNYLYGTIQFSKSSRMQVIIDALAHPEKESKKLDNTE